MKNGQEITKTISYKLQFTDRARFMARSLSNLANSIAKGTHELNVNMNIIINIIKGLENTKIISAVLNTQTLKMIH